MSAKLPVDERRRLVAESLLVGNPANNARELPSQADPRVECQIELVVTDIRPYEHNPRRSGNARFDDIKESIRTSGLRNPLTVTRRPGESHFIVEAGGNTRLVALQQLWAETRDPRFHKIVVLFRPWRSESHVLTSHLIENEQRGEMTFWDKAAGLVALKNRLEAEQGRALSLRPLEEAIHDAGLSVNTTTLAHYLYATERLRTLGEAVTDLSGLDVKTMQPRLNALRRYAQARTSITEDELYAAVFEPVFRRIADKYPHSRSFSVATTCEACEEALARHLGESVEVLRAAIGSLKARGERPSEAVSTADRTGSVDAGGERPHGDPVRSGRPGPLPTRDQDASSAGPDLLVHVQALADAAGIGECVHSEPESPTGYCLTAPAATEELPPPRMRAWWLLACLCGHSEGEGASALLLDATFLEWLLDPVDASACAFWRILSHLRQARGGELGALPAGGSSAVGEG